MSPSATERLAARGSGLPARLAARRLRRRFRTGNPHQGAEPLVRLMCAARDPQVAELAREALEHAWEENPRDTRETVWYALWVRTEAAPRHVDLLVEAARFLLEPAPESRYGPAVRVVAALSVETHDGLLLGGDRLVTAAVQATDPRTREALSDLLRTTDHPQLLDALDDAFADALHRRGTARLWDEDGRATPLLDIALANPHLLRPPPPWAAPVQVRYELAVLALMQDRPDLLRDYREEWLVRELLIVSSKELAPEIAERCRRVLLELGPGPGRERLCDQAMRGHATARAVVVEAGHLPADAKRVPLFLFVTEQWERLDRLDPGGAGLRRHRGSYTHDDWDRLEAVARRTGRPCPPRPRPKPIVQSEPPRYRPGGTGTSGSGGYADGGGGFGF